LNIIRLEQIGIVTGSVNNTMDQVRLFLKKGLIGNFLPIELVGIAAGESIGIVTLSGHHNKFPILGKMIVEGKGSVDPESFHEGKTGRIRI